MLAWSQRLGAGKLGIFIPWSFFDFPFTPIEP